MREDAPARLAARRRSLGLSQRELARRSGVHYSDISRLEHGEGTTVGRVQRLAAELGLDPVTLEVVRAVEPVRSRPREVERALELVAAALPGVVIDGLVAELFPEGEWAASARAEAEALIRDEWERAMGWSGRVRDAFLAARAPMAASTGVPSGEAEEKLFLQRMRRNLERGGRG